MTQTPGHHRDRDVRVPGDNPSVRPDRASTPTLSPTNAPSRTTVPLPKTHEAEIVDVWSRTAPRYRRRAVVFLVINIVLFFGLGCFTYSLRTGDPHPLIRPVVSLLSGELAPARYPYWALWRACFNPFAEHQVTLTDFLMFPISVEQVPAHIIIVGLLMASLVTIPILVAMLYRLPVAIIFLVVVGFVAIFPWLAMALLIGCVIATVRPFHFSFRYATFLLALAPVIIYFFTATRNVSPTVVAMVAPGERMKLFVPWILAVVASGIGGGVVLAIAHVINYRPGGIAPWLAVLFVVPVVLFYTEVGPDELAYRLLEHDYGPNSGRVFVDMDTRELVERAAELEWVADTDKDKREIKAIIQNKMLMLQLALPTELFRQQREVVDQCRRFAERYPESRYYWNCLYLRGRALDMRIDMELLRREALLQFYSDFPSDASRATWKEILGEAPDSPFASVAGLKLAQLEAREGKLRLAQDILERVVKAFSSGIPETPTTSTASGIRRLFAPKPAASSLNVDPQAVAEEAAQLLALIRDNQYGQFKDVVYPDNNPISLLLQCDPRHAKYPENLRHIDQWFPGSKLHDNLIVYQTLTEHDVKTRRDKLVEITDRYRDGDAAPQAMYELGVLELNQNRKNEGVQALKHVLEWYPESPWVPSARRKLMAIDAAPNVE
ncbi:MAG: hypothetical protein JXQ73_10380 [Phycisphaerae bacterium]|nr:hypothetical protein [Phycisphaerae bacterium]